MTILRSLLRRPAFTGLALLALALVTAAATVTFAIFHAVVWRPLPYPEPQRLVAVETLPAAPTPEAEPWASGPDFRDLRAGIRALAALEAVSPEWTVVVQEPTGAERTAALFVSPGLFPLFGATVSEGRLLRAEDDRPGAAPVVLLGHRYWQRKFGGRRGISGAALRVDAGVVTVAGVLAPGFRAHGVGVAGDVDLYFPLVLNPFAARRQVRLLKMAGRLRHGATPEQAADEIRGLERGLAEQYPATNRGIATRLRPLDEAAFGPAKKPLLVLLGFVALLLALASANVANLVLASGLARRREMGIRVALGAAPGRVASLWMSESAVLGLAGGVLGALVAWGGLQLLLNWMPARLPRRDEIGFDWPAAGFAIAVALATALLSAAGPAWQFGRMALAEAMAQGGRGGVSGRGGRLRQLLMAGEVAMALLLLLGAGLLWRSFVAVTNVDPGFRVPGLLTLSTSLPASANTPAQRAALYREMERRIAGVPGVEGVGAASRVPLVGGEIGSWMEIEGRPSDPARRPEVGYRVVTTGYLRVMGVPLKRGRHFDARDDEKPAEVVLVNEALATRYFPGEDAIGRRIRLGGNGPWMEIAGVVGDLRHTGLDVAPRPEVYRPYGVNPLGSPQLVVRAPADALPAIQAAIRQANAGIPVYDVMTMEAAVARAAAPRRFPLLLAGVFAGIAWALALVGLSGILSQWVAERRPALAVRLALGARPAQVAGLVVCQALVITLAGLAAGYLLAALLGSVMAPLVYGVSPFDPVVFLTAPGVLLMLALAASGWPGWRAARVAPAEVLRQG